MKTRKPYQVANFADAIIKVNSQYCQKCESHVEYTDQSTTPEDGRCSLTGVCTACKKDHQILFVLTDLVSNYVEAEEAGDE